MSCFVHLSSRKNTVIRIVAKPLATEITSTIAVLRVRWHSGSKKSWLRQAVIQRFVQFLWPGWISIGA